ncbi:1 isoform X2 [Octopus vulgaris]|uniref:1 isoform X2 n=2 Tax=Octopus TaxID=6643 RepID=A0AA36AR31_OCTVU|nr:chordin-like protein 1 isoform X2 [Octopus sinensis]CAI9719667.1 1 isoform X2 [Octopus vulgaris]
MICRLKQIALLLFFLCRTMARSTKGKDVPEVCTLNDQQYPIGATWHPVLAPFGTMPCANCTCLPKAIVHCVHLTLDCPQPKCVAPKILPNRCCPECEVRSEGETESNKKTGCTFSGRNYEHGDIFASNKTALKPTRENQCVMCICSKGRILCHLKTCEAIKCKKTLNLSDECCPICPDDQEGGIESIDYPSRPHSPESDVKKNNGNNASLPLNNSSESDYANSCTDGAHKNGSTWHPVLTPFGPHPCILCSCINGQTQCSKIDCPKVSCSRPRKVDGKCCPVCKKRRCKGRKCRKRNRINTTPSTGLSHRPGSTTTDPTQIFHNLCMPKGTDRLVYMSNGTDSLMLAFHHIKKSKVDVLRWDIPKKGRLVHFRKETMNAEDFRSRTKSTNILGATNKKRYVNRFSRKLKKQINRCKKTCRQKRVMRLLKQLKLKKVRFTEICKN